MAGVGGTTSGATSVLGAADTVLFDKAGQPIDGWSSSG